MTETMRLKLYIWNLHGETSDGIAFAYANSAGQARRLIVENATVLYRSELEKLLEREPDTITNTLFGDFIRPRQMGE